MIRKKVMRERKVSRNDLLDEGKKKTRKDSKATVNVTYYPVYRNLKSILKEMRVTFLVIDIIKSTS